MNDENIYTKEILKEYKDVLKPKELKEILGIGINKVYKILRKQEIQNKKIGNNYIIPKIKVIEYLIDK